MRYGLRCLKILRDIRELYRYVLAAMPVANRRQQCPLMATDETFSPVIGLLRENDVSALVYLNPHWFEIVPARHAASPGILHIICVSINL